MAKEAKEQSEAKQPKGSRETTLSCSCGCLPPAKTK
jgi:hypothetical protein